MKILYLLTQDLESPLGIGRIWPLAHSLAKRGHEVRIATLHPDWNHLPKRRLILDNVTVEYVAPMHVMKRGNRKLYYNSLKLIYVAYKATWELLKAASSTEVDIIHIGKPHPMNSLAGFLGARLRKAVLCVDCDDYEAGSNTFQKKWQQRIVEYFETHLPRRVQLVTTNSSFMKSKLISWNCPADRIFFLANGIDLERFAPVKEEDVKILRSDLGLDGKFVVLYIGTLSLTNHPVDLLIKAMKRVAIIHPNSRLLIVGGGEDYQRLVELAAELNIAYMTHFVGRVKPDEVPKYYALADVSVDPVYDDDTARGRSPLKLFESWACGVPFVTSAIGEREYLLRQPRAGMLVEPAGDPEAIADGIIQILDHPDLAQELCTLGLEKVKKFSWDQLVIQLEEEYLKRL